MCVLSAPTGASRTPELRFVEYGFSEVRRESAKIRNTRDAPPGAPLVCSSLHSGAKRGGFTREHRRFGKELFAGRAEPETLLRLGGRVGGVRRAAYLRWGAGDTNGAHKPARVRAR